MLKRPLLFALLIFWCCTLASSVSADLIVIMGNGDGQMTPIQVTRGQMNTFKVSIQASAPGDGNNAAFNLPIDLNGYNIAVDFGGNNFGIPGVTSNFSNFGAAVVPGGFNTDNTIGFNNTSAPFFHNLAPGAVNYDFIFDDLRPAALVLTPGATPTALFNITFFVDANATAGIYDILFRLNTTPVSQTNFTTNPAGVGVITRQGSIEISAVPEPSGLFFAGTIGMVVASIRRRNR